MRRGSKSILRELCAEDDKSKSKKKELRQAKTIREATQIALSMGSKS